MRSPNLNILRIVWQLVLAGKAIWRDRIFVKREKLLISRQSKFNLVWRLSYSSSRFQRSDSKYNFSRGSIRETMEACKTEFSRLSETIGISSMARSHLNLVTNS
jgi:hypothetical protein